MNQASQRCIVHVDMDAFFASVAQLDDASLRGRPVIVGGHSQRRGVVSSASYEARAHGVRNGMPLYQARERCPQAVVVPVQMERYREINAQLQEIWGRYSPLVEPLSFDEAFLDLTGCEALLGPVEGVARQLKAAILERTGLTCSVGVGPNKLLAKIGSKRNKPDGLCLVPPDAVDAWLAPMDIGELPGVGPATARQLAALNLRTVAELRGVDPAGLVAYMGPSARRLVQLAHGVDTRPVVPSAPAQSIGAETTFDHDSTDPAQLKAVFYDLVQEVAYRARRSGLYGRTVGIKLRYHDFTTVSRERTLPQASQDDEAIARVVLDLWRTHAEAGRPLRLIGVRLTQLTPVAQLSLWAEPEDASRQRLQRSLDGLRERYGLFVVSRGTHLPAREAGNEPEAPASPPNAR